MNPLLSNITRVVVLSLFSGVMSDILGFRLRVSTFPLGFPLLITVSSFEFEPPFYSNFSVIRTKTMPPLSLDIVLQEIIRVLNSSLIRRKCMVPWSKNKLKLPYEGFFIREYLFILTGYLRLM